ncbi:MAG: hypothetical protein JJT96_07940 [Opitutales bacterium]|nr:hypothetical protein [Opitutales bacterium]
MLIDVGCAEEVTVQVANAAAGINVGVNGILEILKSDNDILDIGGVTVIISSSGGTGEIRFIANPTAITSILLGGEEFFIDHVCALPCGGNSTCLDFENLGSQVFTAGDSFEENGREVHIANFGGGAGGTASASDRNVAGHLGDELHLEEATALIDFGCASGLSMRVSQNENGVFLAINGSSATTNDLSSFDGQTLGGVAIEISNGQMTLVGEIGTFEIGGTSLFLDHICVAPCVAGCIDFETQNGGAEFGKGDVILEDGIAMLVDTFQNNGLVVIEDRTQRAGHLGQDAALFDATLNVGIPCSSEVSLHFGQYAAGVMLSINEDRTIVTELTELNGTLVGGALVEVVATQLHGATIGTLRVTGANISEFTIGGFELVVDHICHVPCPNPGCVDFENFPLGQTFSQGDVFFEEFTRMTVSRFGGPTVPALVTIGNDNFAGGGGKEAVLDRAQINFDFLCAQRVEFSYAFVPGGLPGVRLGVNGTSFQVNNFTMFDQDTLGGAAIEVVGTATAGRVIITAPAFSNGITSVLIGGNDLAIDNICHVECAGGPICIGFDALPLGAIYSWELLNTFQIGNVGFMPSPLTLSNDEIIEDGRIVVSDEKKANYAGLELRFENAAVSVLAGCMRDVSFRFGQYGGPVTLLINDERVTVNSFAELHGQSLGDPARAITVRTLPAPGGEIGLLRIAGDVTSLEIGGENLHIDQLCYAECPVALELGRAFIISDTPINASQRQIVVDVEFSGSGSLILQRSTTLAPGSWTTQSATVTTPGGQPNIRRFTFTVPISQDRIFFRGRATP